MLLFLLLSVKTKGSGKVRRSVARVVQPIHEAGGRRVQRRSAFHELARQSLQVDRQRHDHLPDGLARDQSESVGTLYIFRLIDCVSLLSVCV